MRGLTPSEQRAQLLRNLTQLGMIADDVTLAAIRYPDLSTSDTRALDALRDYLTGLTEDSRRMLPRRRSMADVEALVYQAAATNPPGQAGTERPDLSAIDVRIRDMVEGRAESSEVQQIRAMAEMLSSLTLMLSEHLSNDREQAEWSLPTSRYSAA